MEAGVIFSMNQIPDVGILHKLSIVLFLIHFRMQFEIRCVTQQRSLQTHLCTQEQQVTSFYGKAHSHVY